MSRDELRWRATAAARAAVDRARFALVRPRWDRRALARELAADDQLNYARVALKRGQWDAAQDALAWHFGSARQRFLIAPSARTAVVAAIRREFPGASGDAVARGDRIVNGELDLLGHRGLKCSDWHHDAAHGRTAPRVFWTKVPFLDAAVGDHKVIWELNRHQHWLALGRAYWLSGDARYRDACLADLASWMDANPPLAGINWASMLELAFRAISWIWAIQFFAEPREGDRSPWLIDLLAGLTRQLRHVEQNLSHYFSPNTHLLGEALGLYVAGRTLPELAASGRWAATGRSILVAEIGRQIAKDGGHAERSAHYHRYTLDFYLMALAVARISGDARDTIETFEDAARRLAVACRLLADDRGRLPQLGDDDGGSLVPICGRATNDVGDSLAIAGALLDHPDLRIGQPPEEAFWFLAHPALRAPLDELASAEPPEPPASGALVDTGYYVSRTPSGDHLVVDAGPHGYQNGGHAHADALSMTLSVRGNPLAIDPGTGTYTIDPAVRDRFRSTDLHNTLTLDRRSQSAPRGPFHWAHTATASAARWRVNGAFDYIDAAHDGYAPLEHRRHVLALHRDLVIVADLVSPRRATCPGDARDSEHTANVHWHLDPRWSVELFGRTASLSQAGDCVALLTPDGAIESFTGDVETGLGWHAPVYGRIAPTTTLRIAKRGTLPLWLVSVFSLNRSSTIDRVEYVPVWCEAGVLSSSVAVRITRRGATDWFAVAHRGSQAAAPSSDGRLDARPTWRVGEFETDAHMFFCSVADDGRVARAALVDGSFVRAGGRRFAIALPRIVTDLNVDLAAAADGSRPPQARLSGPGFGARIVVAGRELPIAADRRTSPRGTRGRVPVNE